MKRKSNFDSSELSKTASLNAAATAIIKKLEAEHPSVQLGRLISADIENNPTNWGKKYVGYEIRQAQSIRESNKRSYQKTKGRTKAINTIKDIEQQYGSSFIFDLLDPK